jgi:hypothetical protein
MKFIRAFADIFFKLDHITKLKKATQQNKVHIAPVVPITKKPSVQGHSTPVMRANAMPQRSHTAKPSTSAGPTATTKRTTPSNKPKRSW